MRFPVTLQLVNSLIALSKAGGVAVKAPARACMVSSIKGTSDLNTYCSVSTAVWVSVPLLLLRDILIGGAYRRGDNAGEKSFKFVVKGSRFEPLLLLLSHLDTLS